MGFTTDNPPIWLRPLLDEYPNVTVKECGYRQGSWANLELEDGSTAQFNRTVSKDIEIGRRVIKTGHDVPTGTNDKAEIEEAIGQSLLDTLGGFESLETAIEQTT